MKACAKCGEENPERARFCLACGAQLEDTSAPAIGSRRVVSIVFADVVGSTSLGEKTDPETMRSVMTRYFEEVRGVLEAHGGTVEKFIGDAVMAVFGVPQLHEDDALRAVRAAWQMRLALENLNDEFDQRWALRLAVRTGVNTGEVMAGDSTSDSLVVGDAVNVAARLEQNAAAGEIFLGPSTYRLVRDAVIVEPVPELAAKGKSEPMQAYRLTSIDEEAMGSARRLDAPLVGRDNELDLLERALERTTRERNCHLFTVLGAAGVGKSRLVEEFLGRHEDSVVLRGRCLPYGDGITFWPMADLLDDAAGISETDDADAALAKLRAAVGDDSQADLIARRLATMVGLSEEAAPSEEMFWAARKLLENIARGSKLIVAFDDIHWAEPTFLDLIEHFAEWTRNAPILLIAMARPELLDERKAWGGGLMNTTSILLEPLSADESRAVVAQIMGNVEVPQEVSEQVVTAAEGNPLFVEEMISMLVEDGTLAREGKRWRLTSSATKIAVPPTISALVAARLDHLQREERQVLEYAAVMGKVFWSEAVAHLAGEGTSVTVEPSLMSLVRKDLIRPEIAADQDTFAFRHILIRDAAYDGMPKQTRAVLHQRFASWLGEATGDREREYEEIIGYHLESAFRYKSELGTADAERDEIGREAAIRLLAAGRRAYNRFDIPAAVNLFGRSLELMPKRDPQRFGLLLNTFTTRLESGQLEAAKEVLEELRDLAGGDESQRAAVRLCEFDLNFYGGTEPVANLRSEVEEAIRALEAVGDDDVLTRAWAAMTAIDLTLCRADAFGKANEKMREHAERAGNGKALVEATFWRRAALGLGPSPRRVVKAEGEKLPAATDSKMAQLGRPILRSQVIAMEGRIDEAVGTVEAVRREMLEIGVKMLWASTSMQTGWYLSWADRWEEAERVLRQGYDVLLEAGETGFRSTTAAELANALYNLGRYEEASAMAREACDTGPADDVATQAGWRRVEAKLAARAGDTETALRLISEIEELWTGSDFLNMIGLSYSDIAEAYRLLGRIEDARRAYERALTLFQQKENDIMAATVKRRLEDLENTSDKAS